MALCLRAHISLNAGTRNSLQYNLIEEFTCMQCIGGQAEEEEEEEAGTATSTTITILQYKKKRKIPQSQRPATSIEEKLSELERDKNLKKAAQIFRFLLLFSETILTRKCTVSTKRTLPAPGINLWHFSRGRINHALPRNYVLRLNA